MKPIPSHFAPVLVTFTWDCELSETEAAPFIGAPQFGQAAALSDTSLPHSEHVINAIVLRLLFYV
jgi:hypothetical protein